MELSAALEYISKFKWDREDVLGGPLYQPIAVVALYLASIPALAWIMRDRTAFKLDHVVAAHNAVLCIGSAVMLAVLVVGLVQYVQEWSFNAIFCPTTPGQLTGTTTFALYLFYLSKFYELADTVIRVLRKNDIIFLHWYHHAIVVFMVWSWIDEGLVFGSMGMAANTLVHVFMYYYYFASALGRRVWFKRYITQMQIVQFITSFVLSGWYIYQHLTNDCLGTHSYAFPFTLACNFSFLLLFLRFYKSAYKKKE